MMRWRNGAFSVLSVALAAVIFLTSCVQKLSPSDYFSHTDQRFRAEVRGTLYGEGFCAVVEADFAPTGVRISRISYLSPAHLAGVSVEDLGDGTATVSFDGASVAVTRASVSGLLLPIDLLLLEGDVLTVRKDGDTTTVTLPDGLSLSLSSTNPISVSAPTCSYSIAWWEVF